MAMRINPDDMKPTYQIDDERDEPRKIDHTDSYDYTMDSTEGRSGEIAVMTQADYRVMFERLMPKGTASDVSPFSKLAEMEAPAESAEDRATRRSDAEVAYVEQRYHSANAMAQALNRGPGSRSLIDEIRENGSWTADDGTVFVLSSAMLSKEEKLLADDTNQSIISIAPNGDRQIAEIRDIQGFLTAKYEIDAAERIADHLEGVAGEKTMLDRLIERGEGAEWNDRSNGISWTISDDREHIIASYQDGHDRAGQRDVARIDEVSGTIQERHDSILAERAERQAAIDIAKNMERDQLAVLGTMNYQRDDEKGLEWRLDKETGKVIQKSDDGKEISADANMVDSAIERQEAAEALKMKKQERDANAPEHTTEQKERIWGAGVLNRAVEDRIERFRDGDLNERRELEPKEDSRDFSDDNFAADMAELSSDKQQPTRDEIVAHLRELDEGTGFSIQGDDANRHYNLKGDALSEIVNDGEKVEWNVYDANDTEKLIEGSE